MHVCVVRSEFAEFACRAATRFWSSSCSNGGQRGGSEVLVGVGEALELLLVYGGENIWVGWREHRRSCREELVEIFPLFTALLKNRCIKNAHVLLSTVPSNPSIKRNDLTIVKLKA